MSEVEKRRGLIPFRIPLPNPLSWRPAIPGFGRRRQKRNGSNFASTSVATISETVLASSTQASSMVAPTAAPPAAPVKVQLKPASDVFAGALARAASQSTIHPLDTLKVRLQTAGASGMATKQPAAVRVMPPGVSKFGQLVPPPAPAAAPALAFDGRAALASLGSLYRGVVGAASGAGIAIGTYFAFYGAACNALSRHTDMPATSVAFVSGGIAAAGSSVVKVPLAVCIRSVQAGKYPNVFAAAKSIVTAAGPRGLFTGFVPTVLEDVPDMAIKFAAYESMRQVHRKVYNGRPASPQEDFAMGAVSGALAAAATTPLDVIKTNMMCNAASRMAMGEAASMVMQQGGPAAFFRGVGPRALSNGINSAVFFCFFEAIRGAIANSKKNAALAHHPAAALQQQLQLAPATGGSAATA